MWRDIPWTGIPKTSDKHILKTDARRKLQLKSNTRRLTSPCHNAFTTQEETRWRIRVLISQQLTNGRRVIKTPRLLDWRTFLPRAARAFCLFIATDELPSFSSARIPDLKTERRFSTADWRMEQHGTKPTCIYINTQHTKILKIVTNISRWVQKCYC